MIVSICIITYKRPEGLKLLLEGLNRLTFSKIECPKIQVGIVDNDANGSAKDTLDSVQAYFKWSLSYDVEPKQGISFARNQSIQLADPKSDFIAFIDDDEVPEPNWLEELLVVQAEYDADAVYGKVIPVFHDKVPSWIVKGRFFEQRHYSNGQPLEAAYTHNVLVRAQLLFHQEKVFDERFALTGGEDSYFFRTLHHKGHHLVWADNAIVNESIPSSRTTMKWLLLRKYRSSMTYTMWAQETTPTFKNRAQLTTKAIGQISLGILLLPPSIVMGQDAVIKNLIHIFKGSGRLSALAGIKYEEYRKRKY